MSKKEVYTCDKCEKEKRVDQMKKVELKMQEPTTTVRQAIRVEKDICLDCLKKLGFKVEFDSTAFTENRETFEDKFIELLQDLLGDMGVEANG